MSSAAVAAVVRGRSRRNRHRGRNVTAVVDPVTLEVIRNTLTATAEEMSLVVVMRSARSPLLREAGPVAIAIEAAT